MKILDNIKSVLFYVFIASIVTPFIIYFVGREIAYNQGKKYYEKIKNNKKVYVYDHINTTIFPSHYIKDTSYFSGLKLYYDSVKKNARKIPIRFPIEFMPHFKSVYIVGYEKDSALVKVVSFKVCCMGYYEGYVMREAIHDKPLSDSLLKELKNQPIYTDHQGSNSEPRYSSDYGVYCIGVDCDD